jgi:aryl-alcohol dehydrogenase-like predicted oxidoreductase
MKYRKLGRSELNVSVIGLGCWAIGGNKWGSTDDNESLTAIRRSAELGVNFFDTADFYGFGHSEELLGKALSKNADAIIATKVGLRWNGKGKIRHDLSHSYVKQTCEASLKRLQRETIDLYQIHWPDPDTPVSETVKALDELVGEGKIRFVGSCNFNKRLLSELTKYSWFVSDQEELNLFNLSPMIENIPYCVEKNLGFIGYEPLFKGMLTGKFAEKPVFPKGDHRKYEDRFNSKFNFYKPKIDLLVQKAKENSLAPAQLALALLLINSGVTTVIPGAKTPAQAEENISAVEVDEKLLTSLGKEIDEVFREK